MLCKVSKAYIFGSQVKGTSTAKSDIDFIIELKNKNLDKNDLITISSIKNDLETCLSKDIDIIVSPSDEFYKKVENSIIQVI